MNKVICDICGTDYPETASQCPICGCAKAGGTQTGAGNATKEETGYTYVKGGRFSKANVRKRLKAGQKQAADIQAKQLEAVNNSVSDDEFDEDELDNVSNKGLIIIVILLLLAIIAVGSYIAVTFLGGSNDGEPTGQSQQTTVPQPSETKPTESQGAAVPCTKLTLHDSEIVMENSNAPFELYWQVEPENTTELLEFTSADPEIATVDANGVVTAVGDGETVITVKCGAFEAQCKVVCKLEAVTDPTTENTDNTEVTDPSDVPDTPVELKLNKSDFTLFSKDESYQIKVTTEGLDASMVTWSSDNEAIATVKDGLVVAVGVGRTTIRASYDGQEVICKVSCRWEETEQPTDPSEQPTDPSEQPTDPSEQPTDPSEQPTDPSEQPTEAVSHELLVNGKAPKYPYNGMENSAEFTLYVGEDPNRNQVTLQITNGENMVWKNSNEAVCTVDANGKVVAAAKGEAVLTAEVDGMVFTVMVRVEQ